MVASAFCLRCQEVGVNQGERDSVVYQVVNPVKSTLWGNSYYFAAGVNLSRNTEYDFNIGRTYGATDISDRGLGAHTMQSWGLGYGLSTVSGSDVHSLKAFYELDFFPFIVIGNLALRGDYIYAFDRKQHYFRPSVGWTFVHLDITYNYSFLVNGTFGENIYRHGISFKFRLFHRRSNWERWSHEHLRSFSNN
jgi:hypothetical protein